MCARRQPDPRIAPALCLLALGATGGRGHNGARPGRRGWWRWPALHTMAHMHPVPSARWHPHTASPIRRPHRSSCRPAGVGLGGSRRSGSGSPAAAPGRPIVTTSDGAIAATTVVAGPPAARFMVVTCRMRRPHQPPCLWPRRSALMVASTTGSGSLAGRPAHGSSFNASSMYVKMKSISSLSSPSQSQ